MEEDKIPSRSDRDKSSFDNTMENNLTGTDPVGATGEKPADTASAADILQWYFSASEEPVTASTEAEPIAEATDNVTEADPAESEAAASATVAAGIGSLSESAGETGIPKRSTQSRTAKNSKEKTRPKKKLNPMITAVFAVLMLFAGAFFGYGMVNTFLPGATVPGTVGNNVNVLLLGCDEREGDSSARSDVIIVATIRPDAKEVGLLSIPRDTRVAIPGHGMDKINHAMAYGGTDMVKASVEQFLQIPIHHVVKVNFDGFINVIDALGGVNIEVPCRMYKPLEAIDLLPGYQTLDGADALAFVRWRGDGTGDYGRIERQQQFISAVTEKLKKMNVKQALNVANAVMDSIETDMGVRQMMGYGMNVIGMDASSVKTYSYTGHSVYIGGVNYVEPNMEEVARIVHEMQYGTEPQPEVMAETAQ